MSYFDSQKDDPWASSFGSSAPAYSFGEQPEAPPFSFAAPEPDFPAPESSFAATQPDFGAPQTTQGKAKNLDFLFYYYVFYKQEFNF